jgi:glycosyltransferase involved in cell wall biosynthesis
MKIVCISASQVPSTAANSIEVMKVCQALAQNGCQVSLLAPGREGPPWAELASHYGLKTSFEIEWLPASRRLKRYDFALRAVRRARQLGAQAVYAWPIQAAWMAQLHGLPVLLELHEPPSGRFGPFVFRLFLGGSGRKRLLPITQALADYIETQFGKGRGRTDVVIAPSGVDLERYRNPPRPEEARRLLQLPEKITAGYTGHLYEGRGMSLLAELAVRLPWMQFLWVGGRPEDVQVWRQRLADSGVENVILTGFVENSRLPVYQAAADILLMPYERKIAGSSGGDTARFCSPMKMFEYMACRRAIISSDLPVIREVLHAGSAALCPPEDVDAWAGVLEGLAISPRERQELAAQAAAEVERYTWVERARRSLDGFFKPSQ